MAVKALVTSGASRICSVEERPRCMRLAGGSGKLEARWREQRDGQLEGRRKKRDSPEVRLWAVNYWVDVSRVSTAKELRIDSRTDHGVNGGLNYLDLNAASTPPVSSMWLLCFLYLPLIFTPAATSPLQIINTEPPASSVLISNDPTLIPLPYLRALDIPQFDKIECWLFPWRRWITEHHGVLLKVKRSREDEISSHQTNDKVNPGTSSTYSRYFATAIAA
ncbi:hypothetical protein B0H12DRAFT_1071780 [Mycena haematopus]|nr:hypothetical protein B0H12DRAFT_1071780 [Mycena haematopus]